VQYSREAAAGRAPGPPLRVTAGGRFVSSALVAGGDEAGGGQKRRAQDGVGGSENRKRPARG